MVQWLVIKEADFVFDPRDDVLSNYSPVQKVQLFYKLIFFDWIKPYFNMATLNSISDC